MCPPVTCATSAPSAVVGGGASIADGGSGDFSASSLYVSPPQYGVTTLGLAQANLAAGTLKASSYVNVPGGCTPDPFGNGCSPGWGINSRAAMWDTVQLVEGPDGEIENISLMPISLSIDGRLAGDPTAFAEVRYYWGWDRNIDVETLPWIELTEAETNFFDILVIPAPDGEYDPMFVFAELRVGAGTHGTTHQWSLADFGNTLHFNWEVPEGLIAQSASGVFMTDLTSAVPEPATWAMMIVGFGLVGAALRRRPDPLAA